MLKYGKEALDWNEALPIGNGFLGAMVYGNPLTNHFQLNEDSIWEKGPMERINPKAVLSLPKLRELLKMGNIEEAEQMLCEDFVGIPETLRSYQTAGDFYAEFTDKNVSYTEYERFLDIDKSFSQYSFKIEDSLYTVNSFASYPRNVICIKFSSNGKRLINMDLRLERDKRFDSYAVEKDSIVMSGQLKERGPFFYEKISVVTDGNTLNTNNILRIKDAKEVCIYISIATSFRFDNPKAYVDSNLADVVNVSYNDLFTEHLKDYESLYSLNSLELANDFDGYTDDLLRNTGLFMKEITELLYAYGRYLLISSSRKGSLPANLQGIWNKDFNPPWESKFTININTEMNYWPAEMCNLSECHLPLFDLMERMVINGRKTALQMYGCKGWVAHHNTDIWADTAPVDLWIPGSFWVMGAAWLSTHIWKHYEYTDDLDFLRKNFYMMKESAEFFEDFLIEHDGYLMTAPSVSPENTFILENGHKGCNGIGCTMDNQILRDLFVDCIKASEILGGDVDFEHRINSMLCKLKPTQIGSKGQILEWDKEYMEEEPGHRHISHLYGLHPSSQITVDQTPELAKAAKVSLEMRLSAGGGHTGWSRAWIINHYVKLWEGDKVYDNLKLFADNSLLPNLFDNHPPFQIDGNFGVCAGICEMFVQSNSERIVLLPAVPEEFNSGELKGVKCVGNITVDIKWKNGELRLLSLKSSKDTNVNVLYKGNSYNIKLQGNNTFVREFEICS